MNTRMTGYTAKGFQKEWLGLMYELEKQRICCLSFLNRIYTQDTATVHFTGVGSQSDPLIATAIGGGGGGGTPGNPSQLIGLTPKNGIAFTFLASDSAPALDQSIVPTWTGNHTFKTGGGITDITLSGTVNLFTFANTANNIDYGLIAADATNMRVGTQISIPLILRTNAVDQVTINPSGSVLVANLAGTGNRMVVADPTGLLTTQAIPTTEVPDNPTALVGLTAVNGTSTKFMRSDAAPALDQGINPIWTGFHEYSVQSTPAKSSLTIKSSLPHFELWNTDAIAESQRWILTGNGNGNFSLATLGTTGLTNQLAINITRTATDVTEHNYYTNGVSRLSIAGLGSITMSSLAGSGTRMVVADPSGILTTQAVPVFTTASAVTLPVVPLVTPFVDGKLEYDGLNLYFTANNARNAITSSAGLYSTDGALTNQRTITGGNYGVTWDTVGLFRITQGDTIIGATYDFNTGTDFLVYDAAHSTNLVMNPTTGLQFEYVDVPTNTPTSQFYVDSKGIYLKNVQEFANNTAAAAVLPVGYIYKTTTGGDATLKIVV